MTNRRKIHSAFPICEVCQTGFMTLPPVLLQEQPAVILLWGRPLAPWSLALDEHSGLEGLCSSGRQSVIPYVHGRTELYCPSLDAPEPILFSTPLK
jgi:hypothetical protein